MCTKPKKQASVKCTLTFYLESIIREGDAVVFEAIKHSLHDDRYILLKMKIDNKKETLISGIKKRIVAYKIKQSNNLPLVWAIPVLMLRSLIPA